MTVAEFRLVVTEKSTGRSALPETQKFAERIFTGLKRLAKDTVPLRLSLYVEDFTTLEVNIIRRIDDNMVIRFPNRPVSEDSVIDMDDELLDALAYYIMAGLERSNAKVFMSMYHTEKDMNNDRLVETVLSDSDNEYDRNFT